MNCNSFIRRDTLTLPTRLHPHLSRSNACGFCLPKKFPLGNLMNLKSPYHMRAIDAVHFVNALFPYRWPALVERHREILCFCEACEAVRKAGITWLGHDDFCSCHAVSLWRCTACGENGRITVCDCGAHGESISPEHIFRGSVPSGLAGFRVRLRIAWSYRSSRWQRLSWFAKGLVPSGWTDWALRALPRPPDRRLYIHKGVVHRKSDGCASCKGPVVWMQWQRGLREME